jgi:hypothetical protein
LTVEVTNQAHRAEVDADACRGLADRLSGQRSRRLMAANSASSGSPRSDGYAVAGVENDAIVRHDAAYRLRDQCIETVLSWICSKPASGVFRDVEEKHAADERAIGALGHHLGVT